jgi:predicted transcriptional regulator
MTVTIDLPPEVAEALRQHAARTGQDLSAVILQAVQEKMARARTFDEICAPFARAVEATGMADEEFDRFFEEIREEVWQDKQGKAG